MLVTLRLKGRSPTSIVKFALPVHEGVAVTADLEVRVVLKNLDFEDATEEAGRAEMAGITDVMIVVGANC